MWIDLRFLLVAARAPLVWLFYKNSVRMMARRILKFFRYAFVSIFIEKRLQIGTS